MKCSRCGEECKENQAFCLKCGTPIQVVPDFNLIEAELASNVGELMDKDEKYHTGEMDYLDDEHYEDYMPAHEVGANLELVDIERFSDTLNMKGFDVDSTNTKDKEIVRRVEDRRQNRENKDNRDNQEIELQAEKKVFKIKAIVFTILAAVIVAGAVLLLQAFNKKNSSSNNFVDLYNEGYDYYTSKDYEKALELLISAKNLASADKEKIKVNKALLATYESIGNNDDDQIKILRELIGLEPSEYEHYEELISIYDSKGMKEDISALIDSVTDVSVKSKLSEYSVAMPKFSDESGNYDNYISLKLTTSGSNKIYYTLDGKTPTTDSTLYTKEIQLDKSGKFVVKAIAVNENGMASKVAENEYVITPSAIEGPAIQPDGGQYYTATDIIINVPADMKCYYTYGNEATIPTTGDTEYTEPVKMLRGKNIFSAIYVSKEGVVSEVSQNVYQLTINSVLNYDDALTILTNYYESSGIAAKVVHETGYITETGEPETAEDYVKADGRILNFSYNCVALIDNDEYYIIDVRELDATGSILSIVRYGIDTVKGTMEQVERDVEHEGQFKLVIEEETTNIGQ